MTDRDGCGVPLTAVVHRERVKPRGLDWDALRVDQPEPAVRPELPSPPPREYGSRAKLSAAACAEAGRLYEAGWSLPDLGKRYGISHQQLRRRLVEIGVQMRSVSEASRLAWANRS